MFNSYFERSFESILVGIFISTNCFGQDLEFGIISFYQFNLDAQDIIGDNNGIIHGALPSKDRFGNSNSSFFFDGVDDFIEIPHSPSLNVENNEDFSISIWVNIAATQQDLRRHNNEIIGKWDAAASSYPYAIGYWNVNATNERKEKIFSFRFDSNACSNVPLITAECKIQPDKWHHLVFVKEGATLKSYEDGLLTGQIQDNSNGTCNTLNNHALYIGKRADNLRYFTGLVDDLSIYKRAISDEEIDLLFSQYGWDSSDLETNFLSFTVDGQNGGTTINTDTKQITLDFECGSNLKNLHSIFQVSENTKVYINDIEQISGVSKNDYSNVLIYTLSDEYGCNKSDWEVLAISNSVNQDEIDNHTAISAFYIEGQVGNSEIDLINHTVSIKMPCNTDIQSLIPDFNIPDKAKALVSSEVQVSGNSIQDFRNQITYVIQNDLDECLIQDWIIDVSKMELSAVELLDRASFLGFELSGQVKPATINPNHKIIDVTVACNAKGNQSVEFIVSDGAKVIKDDQLQRAGLSLNILEDTITYLVTDKEQCGENEWKVFIHKEILTEPDYSDPGFFIPNVFTPNGDDINDTFCIGSNFTGSSLKVLDRYGKKVYTNDYYTNEFDGDNLAEGVYYYSISHPCYSQSVKGYVSILR